MKPVLEATRTSVAMDRRLTVLIAEDEPDNREVIRSIVEDVGGHRALLAADGEEALRLAEEELPDVVLLDLVLPRLTGFEVTRRLKANSRTAHIPVIAITALGRWQDRREAYSAGAADYLEKPFDLDALLQKLRANADALRPSRPPGETDG